MNLHEFQASLAFVASSRSARVTLHSKTMSQENKTNKQDIHSLVAGEMAQWVKALGMLVDPQTPHKSPL